MRAFVIKALRNRIFVWQYIKITQLGHKSKALSQENKWEFCQREASIREIGGKKQFKRISVTICLVTMCNRRR